MFKVDEKMFVFIVIFVLVVSMYYFMLSCFFFVLLIFVLGMEVSRDVMVVYKCYFSKLICCLNKVDIIFVGEDD